MCFLENRSTGLGRDEGDEGLVNDDAQAEMGLFFNRK
jgi:hypothetical protein